MSALTEDFLLHLFAAAFQKEIICSAFKQHMKPEYLPSPEYQKLMNAITKSYGLYNCVPDIDILKEQFKTDGEVKDLLYDIKEDRYKGTTDALLDTLEDYIKSVHLQNVYTDVGKLYNQGDQDKAQAKLSEYAQWLSEFTLKSTAFVDVIEGLESRYEQNKKNRIEEKKYGKKEIVRFYIDELDARNKGKNLRGQLTCFLASTGVGKSHIARWIGQQAATVDGLDILHFQLEGSESEVVDAYSGGLLEKSSHSFEKGYIPQTEFKEALKKIKECSGSIKVRSFPRFNNHVSTLDIKNGISEYRKLTGKNPDIVIIDSLDLLNDASGRQWDAKSERMKRVAATNDLKDLANDEDVWMVTTYQATIEDKEKINNEAFTLSEHNCAEAKGIARPLTHLISLNQTATERKEQTMRLHFAKSRFFAPGEPFKIATDYENEKFYDASRSLRLNG